LSPIFSKLQTIAINFLNQIMENQKLPNTTIVLLLGLFSIITCWVMGIVGLIFGIVALVIAKGDLRLYRENPDSYTNFANLAIGRVLAVIGIILSSIYLAFIIFIYTVIGIENVDEWQKNLQNKIEYQEQHR
jgi:predicted PurR-regulated permease PerM